MNHHRIRKMKPVKSDATRSRRAKQLATTRRLQRQLTTIEVRTVNA